MIKRLRDFARKDDAVIEVFSEILLTGIIVIAIAAAAAFVLSSLDEPDNARVDIDYRVDNETDTLYFRHSGGETVDVEDLELLVYVNGSYETLTSEQIRANYDSDEWALGDVIEINTSSQFNYNITNDAKVPAKLVHTASSLVIYDAYGSIGDSGTGGGGSGDDEGGNGGEDGGDGDLATAPALSNHDPSLTYTSTVLETVTFSATSNQSSNNDFLLNGTRVAWSNGTSPSYTNTTPSVGTYNLTLIARNQTDPSLTDSISWVWTVEESNESPIANFSYFPSSPEVSQTITFNANNSSDSDGSIISYEWDWTNDGTYDDTGVSETHSYSSPGSYDVKLKVTDDDGETATTSETVVVVGPLVYLNDAIALDKDGDGTPSGVQFNVRNYGDEDLTVVSINITPENTTVRGLNDPSSGEGQWMSEFYVDSGGVGYTTDFNFGETLPDTFDLSEAGNENDEPILAANSNATFSLYQFTDGSGGGTSSGIPIDIAGESVDITLTMEDGSSYSFTFKATAEDDSTPPLPIPVSLWKFDGSSSDTAIDSKDGNNGTIIGASKVSSDIYGQSIKFDQGSGVGGGNKEYIQIPDSSNLDLTNAGSLEVWVKAESSSSSGALIHKYSSSGANGAYSLSLIGNSISFVVNGVSITSLISGDITEWHHIVATWNSSGSSIYVDGNSLYSHSSSGVAPVTDGPLCLGCSIYKHNNNNNKYKYDSYFDGKVDEVAIYDYALNATEVQNRYNLYS